MEYWIKHGANPNKIVLGLAPYGRGFTLANPGQKQGPLSAVSGPSARGAQSGEEGYMSYLEISDLITKEGAVEYYDAERQSNYLITKDGNTWIGFDNPSSLTRKVEWLKEKGLRGSMVWAIELDDFRNQKFPCLRAIKKAMLGYRS